MNSTIEKMVDQKVIDREQLTVVELSEKEMEAVNGGCFFPFNNSTSLAATSIAFTTNNNGIF